ncbi:MAG: BCCT family transporter [Eubacterium sp.]|nr:BCCT family transporter [Eubacterium sp.]
MKKLLGSVDKTIFTVSVIITLALALVSMLFTAQVSDIFTNIFDFFSNQLGFAYIAFALFVIIACLFVSISPYGKIRLGKDDEKPEYSNISWFSMIFAAGMGIGLVFWSVAEPMNHFLVPPFAEPGTSEAAEEALTYTFLHWGVHPWALYAAVALPMAYFHFRKDLPLLVSSSFYPFLKEKALKGGLSKSIDTFTIILILIGVATSFGLGALQIQSGIDFVFGLSGGNLLAILIVIVCAVLFILSSTAGVDRGMKLLSNTNTVIVFAVMIFVLVAGPTLYIMNITLQSVGDYISNFIPMSFFTDASGTVAAHTGENWIGTWTIFYWAWWITWTPFVGSFIAKISRGRTIREFVFAILGVPTIMSCIWFGIMGGAGLNMELTNPGSIIQNNVVDTNSTVFQMLHHLPFSGFISVLVMLSLLVFFLTSADAGVQVVSTMSSRGKDNTSNLIKIIWGAILGLLAIMFIVTGGLSAVQSLSFAFSFPFLIIICLMLAGFFKYLRKEERKK